MNLHKPGHNPEPIHCTFTLYNIHDKTVLKYVCLEKGWISCFRQCIHYHLSLITLPADPNHSRGTHCIYLGRFTLQTYILVHAL